jgi:hypothetical protein
MPVEVFVFFFNNCFAKQGRYLFQFGFHAPFLVAGKKGMHYFTFAVSDNGAVFYFIGKRKYPVKCKENNDQRRDGDQQAFGVFEQEWRVTVPNRGTPNEAF